MSVTRYLSLNVTLLNPLDVQSKKVDDLPPLPVISSCFQIPLCPNAILPGSARVPVWLSQGFLSSQYRRAERKEITLQPRSLSSYPAHTTALPRQSEDLKRTYLPVSTDLLCLLHHTMLFCKPALPCTVQASFTEKESNILE